MPHASQLGYPTMEKVIPVGISPNYLPTAEISMHGTSNGTHIFGEIILRPSLLAYNVEGTNVVYFPVSCLLLVKASDGTLIDSGMTTTLWNQSETSSSSSPNINFGRPVKPAPTETTVFIYTHHPQAVTATCSFDIQIPTHFFEYSPFTITATVLFRRVTPHGALPAADRNSGEFKITTAPITVRHPGSSA